MAVSEFAKFIVTGVIGVFVGVGGTFFSFKSATTAENQFYMQMDFRRYQTASSLDIKPENRLKALKKLKEAYNSGYESVFIKNIDNDIVEIETTLALFEAERKKSIEAEKIAREADAKRSLELAKQKAQQAVRQNPVIFEACLQPNSKVLCP